MPFSTEEEKAKRKEKQEAEAREANRRQSERRLEGVEQRTLAEQHGALCEAELTVTKPADSSLGASFIDVSDRRGISVKLHLPRQTQERSNVAITFFTLINLFNLIIGSPGKVKKVHPILPDFVVSSFFPPYLFQFNNPGPSSQR